VRAIYGPESKESRISRGDATTAAGGFALRQRGNAIIYLPATRRGGRECPDSEVRNIVLHTRLRTSGSKDTSNLLI